MKLFQKANNLLDRIGDLKGKVDDLKGRGTRAANRTIDSIEEFELPVIKTENGVDKSTMLFVGVAIVGAWFLFKKRK